MPDLIELKSRATVLGREGVSGDSSSGGKTPSNKRLGKSTENIEENNSCQKEYNKQPVVSVMNMLCYIYLEDNGYTTGALCLNCTMIIASEIANSENRPWRKSNGLYNPKEGGE